MQPLQPTVVAVLVFGCIFGGAMLGLFVKRFLPGHHLNADSKDAVKLGAGVIATMAALVLGILVSSAKSSFDGINTDVTQGGAKFILLDRVLEQYGPETAGMRPLVRSTVQKIADHLWGRGLTPLRSTSPMSDEVSADLESLTQQIRILAPSSPSQILLHAQAVDLSNQLMTYRWLVLEQEQNRIHPFFLCILVFWFSALNFVYGLFAPANGTVIAVFVTCAVAVAAGIFLILEMNHPLEGIIRIPSTSFEKTLLYLGQ